MPANKSSYSHKTFFRFFPPPSLMLMSAVGVDISDHAVRFIELKRNGSQVSVGAFAEQVLPEGAIVAGEIKDPSTLKTALINLRRDHKISFVRASLPEEKAYLFRTEIPILSPSETYDTIAFQLEEHVPVKLEDSIFDYVVGAPLFGKTDSGTREVVVTVFPKSTVEEYIDIYQGAGLTPLSFEMEGSALIRSLIEEKETGAYMIVDCGALRTSLAIAYDHNLQFATTIEVGGEEITEAIENSLGVSRDEAEKLKKSGAFSRQGEYRDHFQSLLDPIDRLAAEINKHFIYWHNHPDKKECVPPPIEKIVIVGGDANLEGLPERLSLALHAKVEIGNVWKNCFSVDSYIPPLSFADSLTYATAVGLALREK